MTPPRGSVRRQVRIARPPDEVWAIVGDPGRIQEWFPGIDSSTVDGTTRVIVTGSGLPMPEEIDLGDDTCLVVYSTDADPRAMALTIGGATAAALDELKRQMDSALAGAAP